MTDFLSQLANVLNSPQVQRSFERTMNTGWVPFDVINAREGREAQEMQEARQMQAMQQQRAYAMQIIQEKGSELSPQDILEIGSVDPELGQMAARVYSDAQNRALGLDNPAAVREYEYYNQLTPEQQAQYLGVKRAQQTLNLGGTQAVLDPVQGGIREEFAVTPKPEQMPDFKAAQSRATVTGKELGEADATLESSVAKLPQLFQTVKKLDELAGKATYTAGGRALDSAMRELGVAPRDSSLARQEYIALVDNQVLPLLRDTFGAQFTQKEGESLKDTLGAPNKSPQEKQAVLRAFIQQKIASINSLQRQTGREETAIEPPVISGAQSGGSGKIKFLGFE